MAVATSNRGGMFLPRVLVLLACLVATGPVLADDAAGATGAILTHASAPRTDFQRAHDALDAASGHSVLAEKAGAAEHPSTDGAHHPESEEAIMPGEPPGHSSADHGPSSAHGDPHGADGVHGSAADSHGGHGDHDHGDHDDHHAAGCHGGHSEHGHNYPLNDEVAITMILFLIVLTIFFEKVKHQLDHGRSPSEKLVINALFGEVTVLGFIALVAFFMMKSHMFEAMSIMIFDDADHMHHLFEEVHFGLFFTMMLYLILVMWVLFVQVATKRRWASLEEQTKKFLRDHGMGDKAKTKGLPLRATKHGLKPPKLPMPKDEYLEWRYNGGGRIPVGFDGVMHKEDDIELESGEGLVTERPASDELHHYMLLRARFIWGAANGEGRKSSQITSSFDFGRYLDNCLGETLEKIVIVHEFTWIAIAVVMVVMYALFERSSDAGSCIILTLIGFLLAGALIWLNFKLSKILVALSPPPESNVRQVLTGHKAAAPAYEALPPVKGMSKHEQLFPFGQKGPDFLIHFLRTTLLLAAVFIVGLFSVFWNLMSANNLHWLLPICLISIAVCMALVRPVLPRLTIVTSVSLLKRPKMVDLTLREVRLESSIKTMKVLATLQSQIRRLKKMNSRTGGGDANRKERTIDPKQKADLYDAFKLFDEDDSGSIDSKELFNLLRNLGQHVDQAEAERLVLEIDTGDDGQISFEEFCQVMADDDDAPVENAAMIAHEMFSMLDQDNSGEITLREFREFLSGLPIDLSVDDVDSMLNDIFGDDDDAAINAHEFEHFLTQNSSGF